MAAKEPKTPDELMKLIASQSKDAVVETENGTIYDPQIKVDVPPPSVSVNVNGFETAVARDIFTAPGGSDEFEQASDLMKLLGNEPHIFNTKLKGAAEEIIPTGLYDRVKTAANCNGQNDEALYLRQILWHALERDAVSLEGAEDERVKERDDNASSPVNVAIAQYLGASQLGRIRALAAAEGVSNLSAVRAIVTNLFKAMKTL